MSARRVSLIGVPTDVGAGHRGASMGPEALRVAGLGEALHARGLDVIDRGHHAGKHNPRRPQECGYSHQQQVVGDFLAWRMFQQARNALVKGGQLWIVGNRHLGYHAKLKRLLRGVEQVAANPKFVVLKATK